MSLSKRCNLEVASSSLAWSINYLERTVFFPLSFPALIYMYFGTMLGQRLQSLRFQQWPFVATSYAARRTSSAFLLCTLVSTARHIPSSANFSVHIYGEGPWRQRFTLLNFRSTVVEYWTTDTMEGEAPAIVSTRSVIYSQNIYANTDVFLKVLDNGSGMCKAGCK